MRTTATAGAAAGAAARAAGLPAFDAAAEAALLEIARQTVEAVVRGRDRHLPSVPHEPPTELPAALERPAGAFVTLTEDGELRGCLGRMDSDRPLWANVLDAAAAVPIADHRFIPVAPGELDRLRIEVTVVGPSVPLADVADFVPARDGIVVERAARRAVLLPQVARERGWDAATTLAAVCDKAGLPTDAWRQQGTRLAVFATHAVEEPEPG